ncbi:MAG TPA: hypothetical protein PK228_05940 [Saprospiraceae bacterium]|nr:hypothetical protein [Saprospiraceae bacterium]
MLRKMAARRGVFEQISMNLVNVLVRDRTKRLAGGLDYGVQRSAGLKIMIPDGMWFAKKTECLRYSPGDS